MKNKIRYICYASIIAALYCVLSFVSASFGLSNGFIQLRLSEALCVLVYFTPSAIPGLAVGCLITNILTGALPVDIVCGTLATLVGAVIAYKIKNKYLVSIPNIVANTAVVPIILAYFYKVESALPLIFASIFISEFICSGILGTALLVAVEKLEKNGKKIFK